MSLNKEKDLDLLFETSPPRGLSAYDIFEEAWENHESRLATLEEGFLDTVHKIEKLDEKIESNVKRFRSVVKTGIASTSLFLVCIGLLLTMDYITFEVGVPMFVGVCAILVGFLDGWRKNR